MKNKQKIFISGLVIFSVVLNIFLIGVVVGHVVKHFPRKNFAKIAGTLAPEKRKLLTSMMNDIRLENRKTIRQLRGDILEILTAPTFDAQAYQKKADELQQIRQEMSIRRSKVIKELASQFTQQERKALIKYLRPKKGHMGKKHKFERR